MELFTIENLSFTYPDMDKPALEGISLSVSQGEFLLLCGKSGCGKTTLLRHLKPALTPAGEREGEISFFGRSIADVPERELAEKIGFVLQNPEHQIVTDKVWHELVFGMENLGYPQHRMQLRAAEMSGFFGIQDWFHQDVSTLSGGQKQLLNLASVMALQPDVLILDEPTSQLDPIAASEFLSVLSRIHRESGTAIILIEHRMDEVFPLADRVAVLEDGRLTAVDKPEGIARHMEGHDFFLSMPVPIQVFAGSRSFGNCPVSVNDGRNWLSGRVGYSDKGRILSGSFSEQKAPITDRMIGSAADPALLLKDIWFRYEKDSPDVIRGASLSVRQGEIHCLLGGNGVGKSTLLGIFMGILHPYRGKVMVLGERRNRSMYRTKGKDNSSHTFQPMALLPQNPQDLFVGFTVYEDLEEMFPDIIGTKQEKREKLERIADETQIRHLLAQHPYDLSGGEQQRAALAKILMLEPRVLLLDEPTKGMDGYYKEQFANILHKLANKGTTILIVTHDTEFSAAYADTCSLFFDGRVVISSAPPSFFPGNSFYTTAANRMARHVFPDALTSADVIRGIQGLDQSDAAN